MHYLRGEVGIGTSIKRICRTNVFSRATQMVRLCREG